MYVEQSGRHDARLTPGQVKSGGGGERKEGRGGGGSEEKEGELVILFTHTHLPRIYITYLLFNFVIDDDDNDDVDDDDDNDTTY